MCVLHRHVGLTICLASPRSYAGYDGTETRAIYWWEFLSRRFGWRKRATRKRGRDACLSTYVDIRGVVCTLSAAMAGVDRGPTSTLSSIKNSNIERILLLFSFFFFFWKEKRGEGESGANFCFLF